MPADEPSEPPSAFADLDSEESTQLDENENSQVEVRKGGMPTWHGLGIGGDPLTYSNSLDLLSEDQKEIVALVKAHGIVKAMEMKGLCKKRKRQDTASQAWQTSLAPQNEQQLPTLQELVLKS